LHISRLGIHKNHHRKGYGTELVKYAVLKAVEYGVKKITLETETENIPFYEALGFKTTKKYYDSHWGDSASMELTLLS
jgi:ribosomal protein S18 acetylase RimI-like enzyme